MVWRYSLLLFGVVSRAWPQEPRLPHSLALCRAGLRAGRIDLSLVFRAVDRRFCLRLAARVVAHVRPRGGPDDHRPFIAQLQHAPPAWTGGESVQCRPVSFRRSDRVVHLSRSADTDVLSREHSGRRGSGEGRRQSIHGFDAAGSRPSSKSKRSNMVSIGFPESPYSTMRC